MEHIKVHREGPKARALIVPFAEDAPSNDPSSQNSILKLVYLQCNDPKGAEIVNEGEYNISVSITPKFKVPYASNIAFYKLEHTQPVHHSETMTMPDDWPFRMQLNLVRRGWMKTLEKQDQETQDEETQDEEDYGT